MSTNRWTGARCADRSDLPWTADITPTATEQRRMAEVCDSCPIVMSCANYALSRANGGFYAGVWLPWDKTLSTKLQDNRRKARNALRQVVRV